MASRENNKTRGAHVFVDEAKRRQYLVVAVIVAPEDLARIRRSMRQLLLRNQRRIHFKDESVARRQKVLDVIVGLGVSARIYVSSKQAGELEARKSCLRQLVPDLADLGATRLVIERDDSTLTHDRQTLYDAVAKAGCRNTLHYHLLRSHEECLLWIADALAWCWSHEQSWRGHIRPIVSNVIKVGQ